MIYKFLLTLVIFVLSVSLLSACAVHSNIQNPSVSDHSAISANQASPSSSETMSTTDKPVSNSVKSSDNIQWSEVQDPLINSNMKAKLKAAVQAIVEHNLQHFHTAIGQHVGTVHDYLLNNTMNFTKVDTAHQEGTRILVPVSGQLKVAGDTVAKEASYTFYFEKATDGDWRIVAID